MTIAKIFSKNSTDSGSPVYYFTFESSLGKVVTIADEDYLYMVCFEDSKNIEKQIQSIATELSCKFVEEKNKVLIQFEAELLSYLDGKSKKFNVPIKMMGSDFQKQVWKKLLEMSYGSTQTYGELAKSMGRSASHARAIGAACGANLHMVVIPCHRVVATGSKGGFSCGLDRKQWLLNHEKTHSS